jgi:hypothetical protein
MMKRNKKTTPSHAIRGRVIQAIILVITAIALAGCFESGGGGGGLLAGGGIGGTGISIGQISGFGSIIVNDVEFDTRQAEVAVNGRKVGVGDSIVQNELAQGMVVRVEGQFRDNGAGKADRIVFSENVKGPVTDIEMLDSLVKKLVMLGQTVIVTDSTKFKNTDFESLSVDNVLRISGWADGAGVIQATFVARLEASDDEVTVKGVIKEVNVPQQNLRLNQLVVDYSGADLKDFPDGTPTEGQLIAVKGFLDANGVLLAEEVSLENDLGHEEAEDVEIEGIVTQFSTPQDFVLGTTAVQTDEMTEFKGIEPNDIVAGVRLLVKGAVIQSRLLADEVIAKDKVNLEGTVESVAYGPAEIRLRGLNAPVIHVNNVTKIFGDAVELTKIEQDQHVKILGYVAGENKVEAAQVKVEKKASDKVKLQGPVTLIGGRVISVFTVDIDTGTIPDDGFETAEDGLVSRSEFLRLVAEGDTVSANGNLIDKVVEWKGIELIQE